MSKYILVADDNENDLQLAQIALQRGPTGAKLAVVHGGEEVLDYLYCRGCFEGRTDPDPDVILLDIKMPGVDGLDVLRQIKEDDRLRIIPVVMLTSSREESDIAACYRLGANAYVVKPVDFTEFVEAIRVTVTFWTGRNELPHRCAER
ncbi:MAG TPA: response regulator [Verrucomicrobiae bacterium]